VDPKRHPHRGLAASSPGSAPHPASAPGAGTATGVSVPRAAAAALAGPAGKLDPARTPGAPTVSESIDQLAGEIRQLRVDFERFFSGALLVPPDELRRRVQARLRQLRSLNTMSAVDRFRLGDLEARHNSYDELFTRRLRDREEGRLRAGYPPPQPPRPMAPADHVPGDPSAPFAPPGDPGAGIVIGPDPDPRAVADLYEQVTAAGAPGGGAEGPRFDLASFGSYLRRQAAAIRAKTGCAEVQFRLAAEDGKLRLKARPLPPVTPTTPVTPASPVRSKEKT
jgi:hypothetical protein